MLQAVTSAERRLISLTNIKFNKQIMRNAFPNAGTSGALFANMGSGMPWSELISNAIELDNMYFESHSGDKFCANIVYQFLDTDGECTTAGKTALAGMLRRRFIYSWAHLWDAYTIQYNLDRDWFTHRTARTDDDLKHGKTVNGSKVYNDSMTRTDNLTETRDDTRTDNLHEAHDDTRTDNLSVSSTNLNSVYGYNTASTDGVPSDKSVASESNTGTQRNAGTVDNTGTERNAGTTLNTGTQTNQDSYSEATSSTDSGTDERDISEAEDAYGLRSHSIQDLIESEKTVWVWDYFEQVFRDIDSVLCLKIFEPSLIRREYEFSPTN